MKSLKISKFGKFLGNCAVCSPICPSWPGFPLSLNDGWCVHKTSSVDNFQQSFESFDRHSKWNKSENLWFSLVLLHCLNKQELQASSNPSTSYSTKATILVWIGLGWMGFIFVSYIWPGGSNQHTDLKRVTHFEQEGQHGIKWDQKLVLGGLPLVRFPDPPYGVTFKSVGEPD